MIPGDLIVPVLGWFNVYSHHKTSILGTPLKLASFYVDEVPTAQPNISWTPRMLALVIGLTLEVGLAADPTLQLGHF